MKFFQKYLSVWVILCMIIGVSIGHFFPMIPNILNKFEYAGISIPMAVLIWIMIYPMMIKVDFKSVKYISKNPKGLFVTWIVNWLIKPFTMYGIACLFFFGLFRAFIPVELATEYLAGAVLLGAAPCTAMVFVWSSLTQGNPVYTVVQVATNDIIILFAFGPIVKFLLGVSNVAVPFNTIFLSVVLFVVIPLVGGIITRMAVIRKHDENYLNQQFLNKFDSVTTIGLLLDISADIYVSVGSYSEKSYTHNTDCNTFDNSDIFDLWNRIRSVLSIKTATQYCSTCRNNRSI